MAKHKSKSKTKKPIAPPVDVDGAKRGPGRPRSANTAHTFVRSTPGQRLLWEAAVRFESARLGLPHELSLNSWILMTLDAAASQVAARARGELPAAVVAQYVDGEVKA